MSIYNTSAILAAWEVGSPEGLGRRDKWMYERCVELAEDLPDTSVVHGDCSNMNVLEAQGFDQCDALVTLTGLDETNMIVALYGEKRGVRQIITKISREENNSIANELTLGSVINPRELCSNHIVRYVRAMENQVGAAISVHAIADGKAEAVEFLVDSATKNCGVPLKEIKLKKNVLMAAITHGTRTQIPSGDSYFQKGDSVVVVTSGRGILRNINDIFA
jgi:trk system potassium uptake protein TrkA